MALTRKFLSALGIEDDKVDEIITAHTETVNALKEQRDNFKTDAEKLPEVQKELDELKAVAEKNGKDPYKVKYEALKEDFDKFKAEQVEKDLRTKKENAYKALLEEVGISEKRINAVLKVSDIDAVELDKDGEIKKADELKESIKSEWEDFIVVKDKQGAPTATPPINSNGQALTMKDIYKKDEHGKYVMDSEARQKAIVESLSKGED